MRMIIRGFIQIYLKVVEWTAFEHYRKWRGTYILVAASPRRRLPMNASKLHEKRMVWVVFFTPFPEELPLWCKGCKKPAALARIHRGKEGKRSHGFYLAKHYWNCASARNLGWAIYLFVLSDAETEWRERSTVPIDHWQAQRQYSKWHWEYSEQVERSGGEDVRQARKKTRNRKAPSLCPSTSFWGHFAAEKEEGD